MDKIDNLIIEAINNILMKEPLQERKVYNGGYIISRKENMVLTRPLNNWDTNYHVYELETGKDYLIDTEDVCDTIEELEEYGVITFQDLKELELEDLKEYSWKTIE